VWWNQDLRTKLKFSIYHYVYDYRKYKLDTVQNWGFRWLNRQSKRHSSLRSWVGFSLQTHYTDVKRVQSEIRGLSLGTPVSSTGNVDRVGWDTTQTNRSSLAVLRDQTPVTMWLTEASSESLRLAGSGWAASFIIRLSSQLYESMITHPPPHPHLLTPIIYIRQAPSFFALFNMLSYLRMEKDLRS
jgi:hypothetical protein